MRFGVGVGGTTGTMKVACRNGGVPARYNASGLPGSGGYIQGGPMDWWDTLNPYGYTGQLTLAFSGGTDAWGSEFFCGADQFQNYAATLGFSEIAAGDPGNSGDYAWNSIYWNIGTDLLFTERLGQGDIIEAVNTCKGLNNGSEAGGTVPSNWRLPTLFEMLDLHIQGIVSLWLDIDLAFNDVYKSATTVSSSTTTAFTFNFSTNSLSSTNKTSHDYYFCVHDRGGL